MLAAKGRALPRASAQTTEDCVGDWRCALQILQHAAWVHCHYWKRCGALKVQAGDSGLGACTVTWFHWSIRLVLQSSGL